MTAKEKIQHALDTNTTGDLILTLVLMNSRFSSIVTLVAGDDFTHVDDADGGDYVVLDDDYKVDANVWVDLSEDAMFGGDGSRSIQSLDAGQFATEWRNADYYTCYQPEYFQDRLNFYAQFDE